MRRTWKRYTKSFELCTISAQNSFIQKFQLDFCDKSCRAHTILACETRKNVFYFFSKAHFVLEIIKL